MLRDHVEAILARVEHCVEGQLDGIGGVLHVNAMDCAALDDIGDYVGN